jgi:hypothetical protein
MSGETAFQILILRNYRISWSCELRRTLRDFEKISGETTDTSTIGNVQVFLPDVAAGTGVPTGILDKDFLYGYSTDLSWVFTHLKLL